MSMEKNSEHKGMINISSDDLTNDEIHNNIQFEDPTGKKLLVDMWCYVRYFFDKIQYKDINNSFVYIDGCLTPVIFSKKFVQDKDKEHVSKKIKLLEKFIFDSTCYDFQCQIFDKYNVHINWIALYGLCIYIKEIIDRRYCIILKPSVKEVLNEIGNSENVSELTITMRNGNKITTSYSGIIDLLVSSLTNSKDETFGIDRLEKKVDVYTREYAQVEFVRYISRFFHDYFNIKRRKNSYLSKEEQELIRYLLCFFKFSPEIITDSRFRQLMTSTFSCPEHLQFLNLPGIFESNLAIPLEYVTYTDISKGKINPLYIKKIEKYEVKKFTYKLEGDLSYIHKLIALAKDMYDNKETNWRYSNENEEFKRI